MNKGFSGGPGKRLESHPMWNTLPPSMLVFRTAGGVSRSYGYAAPPSQRAAEVQARYVVVNMFARAIMGQSPRDAVRQAETEIKQIYA